MRQHEQRINSLERKLAVLEAIVERLADSMRAEHEAMREARQEDRASMRRFGEQMEQSIAVLGEKMEKMGDRVVNGQSMTRGVVAGASWAGNVFVAVAGLVVAAGSLVIAYQAGLRGGESDHNTPTHELRPAR